MLLVWHRFYRYRTISFIRHGYSEDLGRFPLEGYTDQLFYFQNEIARLLIHAELKFTSYKSHNLFSKLSAGENQYPVVFRVPLSESITG